MRLYSMSVSVINILFFALMISSTAGAATWKKIVGGIGTIQPCPTNYIFVPALAPYTTVDFCIMKYEAKNDGYLTAVSQPTGTPWVSIDRPTARKRCQALGGEYDLISNDQWQTIARNIAGVASNWSLGSVGGSSYLNRGHSDGNPASVLAASDDDNNACVNTGQTCSSTMWDNQRRTHKLSNGNVIWDFAGNAHEWVTNDSTASNGADALISAMTAGDIRQIRYGAATATICSSGDCGLGYGYFNYSGGAVFRGGSYILTTYSGVFATSLVNASSYSLSSLGFRCVYIP